MTEIASNSFSRQTKKNSEKNASIIEKRLFSPPPPLTPTQPLHVGWYVYFLGPRHTV